MPAASEFLVSSSGQMSVPAETELGILGEVVAERLTRAEIGSL